MTVEEIEPRWIAVITAIPDSPMQKDPSDMVFWSVNIWGESDTELSKAVLLSRLKEMQTDGLLPSGHEIVDVEFAERKKEIRHD